MAGERIAAATLRWAGIDGDRQYAFFRADDRSRFPWLSARDLSRLVLYRACYRDPADPRRSPVDVVSPEGDATDVAAPELLQRLEAETGEKLRLLQTGRGAHDALPVSVATTGTLAAIDRAHGARLDPERFRTNILIDGGPREGGWCGGTLVFGEGAHAPRLLLHDTIPRCALITIDPATAARDPSVMRTVAGGFGNRVGVYGTAARTGTIRVGDPVRLIPAA